jgi:hypothetical protein
MRSGSSPTAAPSRRPQPASAPNKRSQPACPASAPRSGRHHPCPASAASNGGQHPCPASARRSGRHHPCPASAASNGGPHPCPSSAPRESSPEEARSPIPSPARRAADRGRLCQELRRLPPARVTSRQRSAGLSTSATESAAATSTRRGTGALLEPGWSSTTGAASEWEAGTRQPMCRSSAKPQPFAGRDRLRAAGRVQARPHAREVPELTPVHGDRCGRRQRLRTPRGSDVGAAGGTPCARAVVTAAARARPGDRPASGCGRGVSASRYASRSTGRSHRQTRSGPLDRGGPAAAGSTGRSRGAASRARSVVLGGTQPRRSTGRSNSIRAVVGSTGHSLGWIDGSQPPAARRLADRGPLERSQPRAARRVAATDRQAEPARRAFLGGGAPRPDTGRDPAAAAAI